MNKFLNNYFKNIAIFLNNSEKDINKLIHIQKIFKSTAKKRKKIIFCGNGGSAATSSHVAVDLTKNAKIRAINFNEADLITCFSNDYGYENWVTEAIKAYCLIDDLVILISSSGTSPNILNAAKYCKDTNIDLITLSGFSRDNELSKLGKVNFHVDSKNYNHVEMTHHIILLSIVDIFAEKILL